MKPPPTPHYRHRFPAEIISHAVWPYHVFSLSPRDVELILAERGVIVTGKLKIYGVAQREILPKVEHQQSRYLNNRAENSHRPTRRRERQMQRFKSRGQAQDFLSAHGFIHGHFHPRRHLMPASNYRKIRTRAFKVWRQERFAQYVA